MIEAVFQLLFRFEGIITETQIRQALGITSPQDTGELKRLLHLDKRIVNCSHQKWRCIPLEHLIEDKPLRDVTFVVTDIETTGSIRGKDRIIEIAAAKIRDGQIVDQFESLVNPDMTISNQISRLTKISDITVKDAPYIEQVLPEFIEFVDDGVFVAHNSLLIFPLLTQKSDESTQRSLRPRQTSAPTVWPKTSARCPSTGGQWIVALFQL